MEKVLVSGAVRDGLEEDGQLKRECKVRENVKATGCELRLT